MSKYPWVLTGMDRTLWMSGKPTRAIHSPSHLSRRSRTLENPAVPRKSVASGTGDPRADITEEGERMALIGENPTRGTPVCIQRLGTLKVDPENPFPTSFVLSISHGGEFGCITVVGRKRDRRTGS